MTASIASSVDFACVRTSSITCSVEEAVCFGDDVRRLRDDDFGRRFDFLHAVVDLGENGVARAQIAFDCMDVAFARGFELVNNGHDCSR
jgi:hypothetical protein